MITEKVDFLDDLNEFINYIKSQINDNCKFVKIHFYKKGINDNLSLNEHNFSSIDEILEFYKVNDYSMVDVMDFYYMEEDDLKTIHADKKTSYIVIVSKNEVKEKSLKDLKEMQDDDNSVDISKIPFEEGCIYYSFNIGKRKYAVGKWDERLCGYFLLENGQWKRSREVERWINDPAYDYEVINRKPNNVKK